MLFFPDSIKEDEPRPKPTGPQMPRITVTSSPEDIRRAFEAVSAPSTPPRSAPASPPPGPAEAGAGAGETAQPK
jgi:hypothetical protein